MNLHRVNYPVIDRAYTSAIRDELDNGRDVQVTLFTPEEVDYLLDMEDGENEGYIVDLVEEVFIRSHGLKLDLAVEGPANVHLASVEIGRENRHNVYMVSENKARIRSFNLDHYDPDLIPKVSPQDANLATVSLDYSAGRPRVSRIEGLKLDTKSDPVESALTNALVSVQTLMSLGMDVENLIEVVEEIWDIDFVRDLMKTAAFSPTGSMPDFLASGGRPAPSAYLSPNIMSMFQVIQRPTYDSDDAGVANMFLSRSALMAKFISCMTHMFITGSALNLMTFSPNPAQFSRFDPKKISGTSSVRSGSPSVTSLRCMVAHLSSYDDYIHHRQSARAAVRSESWTIERDINAIAVMSLRPTVLDFSMNHITSSIPIMSLGPAPAIIAQTIAEDAAPSKLAAVTWGMFHSDRTPTMYKALMEVRICMIGWCLLETDVNKMHLWWKDFSHVPGVASVLSGMNIARFREHPEVMALLRLESRALDTAGLFVMVRIANMLRESVVEAFESATNFVATQKLPLRMDRPVQFYVGKLFRSVHYANKYLAKVCSVAPFKYSSAVTKCAADQLSNRGALMVNTRVIAKSSNKYDDWLSFTKTHRVSAEKSDVARTRQLFASIRADWSNYYFSKAMSIDNSLKYLNKLQRFSEVRLLDVIENKPYTRGYQHVFAMGLLAEIVICHARALAYKFVSIKVTIALGTSVGKDATKETFDNYMEYLRSVDLDIAMNSVTADKHLEKFTCKENSTAKKCLMHSVDKIAEKSEIFLGCNSMISDAILESYANESYLVGKTIREAVKSDWMALNSDKAAILKAPVKYQAEAEETENLTDRDIALAMSFALAGERYKEPNQFASIVYNLKNISSHMSEVGSEYAMTVARECEVVADTLEINPKCDTLTRCQEIVREFEFASARMDVCCSGDQIDFLPDDALAKLSAMIQSCAEVRRLNIIR